MHSTFTHCDPTCNRLATPGRGAGFGIDPVTGSELDATLADGVLVVAPMGVDAGDVGDFGAGDIGDIGADDVCVGGVELC